MKKVLVIGPTEFKGGIETYVENLIKILGKNFEFSILQFRKLPIADEKFYKDLQIPIIKQVIPDGIVSKLIHRDQNFMRSIFKEEKFDIVHINENSPAGYKWAKAALSAGSQVIYQSHNSYASSLKHELISRFLIRPVRDFQRTKLSELNIKRVAVSDVSAEWMFGTTSDVFYIWNSVNSEKFRFNAENRNIIRQHLNISFDEVVGISVGRVARQKNYKRIVKIASRALAEGAINKFIFVGDGPDMESLKRIIAGLEESLRKCFFLVGAQKNVVPWYSSADVMLMPSVYEGVPFGVVEAQTNGLPVVLSDTITRQVECTDILTFENLASVDAAWVDDLISSMNSTTLEKRSAYADQVNHSRFSQKNFSESIRKLYGI